MSKQALNGMHIRAGFQLMRGKGVTQCMNAAVFGDAGACLGGMVDALCALGQHRQLRIARTRKQPQLRTMRDPVAAQFLEQFRREQCVAVLGALCVRQTYVVVAVGRQSESTLPPRGRQHNFLSDQSS